MCKFFGNVFQGIKHIISLLSCSHIQIFLFLYGIILFTAMAQLGSSLEGRLRNTDLPVTKCLFPVFEAVVNSIYAIDDRLKSDNSFSITEGKIRVILERANTSDLFGGKAELLGITVEDNGIGFTKDNYKSFYLDIYSLYLDFQYHK